MKILALETSAKSVSCAVTENGAPLASAYQCTGLTHSRTLMPMVEDMLKNAELTLDDMDLIAIANGPGSFTGVRIGVSAVKGLAWALDKPVCGVSTLEAMAYNGIAAPEGVIICCAMDARRGQFYNALFEMEGGKPRRLCEDRAISPSELAEEIKNLKKSIFTVGDGAALCYNALDNFEIKTILAPEPMRFQSAWGVCMAAADRPQQTVHELLPVYLRLSQAERERQERVFGK